MQTQDKAQANGKTILTEDGDKRAQAQADQAMIQTPLAEREQPILTQQKVMDLIMQQQTLPNNTGGSLMAASWATKKQGFTDMLSGFRSPTGTTYCVALDLASVLFMSVAAADANRMSTLILISHECLSVFLPIMSKGRIIQWKISAVRSYYRLGCIYQIQMIDLSK